MEIYNGTIRLSQRDITAIAHTLAEINPPPSDSILYKVLQLAIDPVDQAVNLHEPSMDIPYDREFLIAALAAVQSEQISRKLVSRKFFAIGNPSERRGIFSKFYKQKD